ncbi:MAG: hypothetical protein IKH82_03310, partial [Clostridiales bacterium]|nr:hypothetical protein [Clostridiales bacterium]
DRSALAIRLADLSDTSLSGDKPPPRTVIFIQIPLLTQDRQIILFFRQGLPQYQQIATCL